VTGGPETDTQMSPQREGLEGLGKGKEEGKGAPPLFRLNERSGRTACPRAGLGSCSPRIPRPGSM